MISLAEPDLPKEPVQLVDRFGFVVKEAVEAAEISSLIALRTGVFRKNGADDRDEWDSGACHLGFYGENDAVLGSLRYWLHDTPGSEQAGYTGSFFDLVGLEPGASCLELGRLAILKEFRGPDLLRVVTKSLIKLIGTLNPDVVFGCFSVEATDADVGRSILAGISDSKFLPTSPESQAGREPFLCDFQDKPRAIPPLLSFYLGLGARVGKTGVLDRDLGTNVFFTLLEPRDIPHYLRHLS